ncbi:30S ribosomal protein S7 [bacterium TMED181]|nr:30S ribosomal protein S7 [Planctomycetota bacterium]OUW45083.1 MAG: 30S ribosomal protein S7 [bacterium TMED181]
MKQKFRSTQRFQKPDPRFNSMVVTKFINRLMWDGKKAIASGIFYDSMDLLGKKVTDAEPLDVFLAAVQNVMPQVEVRSRRVGGATYQVPVEVTRRRAQALALRTLIETCRGRSGKPMAERLADEFAQAYRKEGASVTWRENTHKMAEANKLFAHYAW